MAVYAIGDLQGCYTALRCLLDKLDFDPRADQLWLAGDLVSRGPGSLEVLRFVKQLGDSAVSVLGNHDVSLIAAYYGVIKPHATLKPVLAAHDCDELIDWLRERPFLHINRSLGFCMAHAGIYPGWSIKQATRYAREIEIPLRGQTTQRWLESVYGDHPMQWSELLTSYKRHRFILNAFTRMRGCEADGSLNFEVRGALEEYANNSLYPWFDLPGRVKLPYRIVFGHWSALDFYVDEHVVGLDTGCVWGRKLTAVRLDEGDFQPVQVSCDTCS